MHYRNISGAHAPSLLASLNTVITVFDFEPFNSVITSHYFSVFFDLYSLWPKNSDFFSFFFFVHATLILDRNYFLFVCDGVWLCGWEFYW